MLIDRKTDTARLENLMGLFPVTAILGARQCGKTTLARQFQADHYFDLENPLDMRRLETPQLTLEKLTGLIVIDEIQRLPELFPLLRYLVDKSPAQKYVILGSASRDLIRQSSETLAGRIGYFHLGGFSLEDVQKLHRLWLRGGFPLSYLAADSQSAFTWLDQYISTFLERDIPQLGITIPPRTLLRFWTMLSHYHGQELNYSELGRSFGISDMTVRKYLDILNGTFMVRILQPWHANVGKRLVKRPKIYLRDSGVFHALQTITTPEQLETNPKLGASWEGFALETVCRTIGKREEEFFFWRTHGGAELDLLWLEGGKHWGVEFKYTDAPGRTKSMHVVMKDLALEHIWVVYPGSIKYPLAKNITALPLDNCQGMWDYR